MINLAACDHAHLPPFPTSDHAHLPSTPNSLVPGLAGAVRVTRLLEVFGHGAILQTAVQ